MDRSSDASEIGPHEEHEHNKTKSGVKKSAWMIVASDQGTFIANRFDRSVCWSLFDIGTYEKEEIELACGLLMLRREYFGPGVIAIDGGANIGIHTVQWARTMTDFGQVVAFEPQERVFYALGGNILINNCHNAVAVQSALGNEEGIIEMIVPDYTSTGHFGGVELKPPAIGGQVSTGQESTLKAPTRIMKLDSLAVERVDFIKLDLEGMEPEALAGAAGMIEEFHPVLMVEHIKSGMYTLRDFLDPYGYESFIFAGNLVCVHRLDKCLDHVRHLHKTLLRREAECSDFNLEWLKFSRPEEKAA